MATNNGWNKAKVVIGVLLGVAAIFTIIYNADCYNVKQAGSEVFATIESVTAMQKAIYKGNLKQDYMDTVRTIKGLEQAYGVGCAACDPETKAFYDMQVAERDRIIKELKGMRAGG